MKLMPDAMMKLKLYRLGIDYDQDYGVSRLTGWSISWDGHYVTRIEPWFVVAVFNALFRPNKIW